MGIAAQDGLAHRDVFRVEIIRQDNHSWQGQIFWANTGTRRNFRSVLELLHLIASAVEDEDEYRSFGSKNTFEDEDEACVPMKVREDISRPPSERCV